jgi:hypothetical protein
MNGSALSAVRFAKIQQAAYYLAQRRGFEPGHELDDWVAAEREIRQLLEPRSADDLDTLAEPDDDDARRWSLSAAEQDIG